MKAIKQLILTAALMLISAVGFSQVTGTVMDGDSGMPLPGASVSVKGTKNGTTTDFDGKFKIDATSAGVLVISYVGFDTKEVVFSSTTQNVGTISLMLNAEELEGVVIVGKGVIDLASDRKTPIAVSTIPYTEIQKKIGTSDVTQTLVNTPSVYVAGQSGGFGDSRITVRGFGQDNTAFLLNGQPINGMEDGKMYWSNWSGMSDIANTIQIQRGLGSSKLAISSVGGTVNFVTKATEQKEGGFGYVGIANDSYYKSTVGYNTGMSESGWGFSFMLSHWQGNGYNDGTKGQGQNYFFSVGYKLNENHNFNFLLTGAPQWHDQNYRKAITSYLEYGTRYNNNWGFSSKDGYKSLRRNYYHKPVANLNWDWTISEKSSLSTVLYASWGRGGGTGGYGSGATYINGGEYDNGLINWDGIEDYNATVDQGVGVGYTGSAIRASVNNHAWYGLVTNFNTELTENLTFNAGFDLRTYKGTHFRQLVEKLGLVGFNEGDVSAQYPTGYVVTNTYEANPWSSLFDYADEDERIGYDYDERINYAGVFAQLEYATDRFSAFFQGAGSNQSHIRWDRFNYTSDEEESEKVNNWGYNVKGGTSYVVAEGHKIYANAGYYSRQPYHDNIYLGYDNNVNPLTENEKITGLEFGYALSLPKFKLNLDFYKTTWENRVKTFTSTESSGYTSATGILVQAGDLVYTTNNGIKQDHMGAELSFAYQALPSLKVKGFASIGNWEYVGESVTIERNEDFDVLDTYTDDYDGGKVGDAAQTTYGLGLDYKIAKGFSVDTDFRYYDDLYADYAAKDNLQLPAFGLLDAGLSYRVFVGETNNNFQFRLNVNNVLNRKYISEASTNIKTTDVAETVNGVDFSYEELGRVYKGLADDNQVYFGYGTTWNFSVKYNF
ncbi:TonB-dependent receptor [Neptunitalea chrysea]|uniref:TonB-dependent receptor n=1 Tax=Neptunitalea chrysea TaxID=1647581 RepID=A0A9W6B930_9FLAO|nr:carboxypeptidase-like regulatory domain-containing protein [Neptunitalea chrysea]GLB54072.1 TonB-dependent receptor [Neptunitalea chrysea]